MQAGFSLWVQIAVMTTCLRTWAGKKRLRTEERRKWRLEGAKELAALRTYVQWRRDGTRRGSRNQIAEDQGRVFRSGKAS